MLPGEQAANARLIAAAPDLLAALERLAAEDQTGACALGGDVHHTALGSFREGACLLCDARAAIAKAVRP